MKKGKRMIQNGISTRKWKKNKPVLHGILAVRHSTECLDCDLVKVAKLAHHLLLSSDHAFQDKVMAKADYFGLGRKINSKGPISRTSSIQKVSRRAVKHQAAMAVPVEANPEKSVRTRLSWARYFSNQLLATIVLLAVHKEKTIFKRHLIHQTRGFKLISRPKLYLSENFFSLIEAEAANSNETKSCATQIVEHVSRDDNGSLKEGNGCKEEVPLRSISVIRRELPESTLGWPLLRKTAPQEALRRCKARNTPLVEWNSDKANVSVNGKTGNSIAKDCKIEGTIIQVIQTSENESIDGSSNGKDDEFGLTTEVSSGSFSLLAKECAQSKPGWPLLCKKMREIETTELSVVQWVMGLPDRSKQESTKSQTELVLKGIESSVDGETCYKDEHNSSCLAAPRKLPKKLELVLKLNSSSCKQFCYEELKGATCQFSSENFIGEGGCSNVYKGYLPSGKSVAIKILKEYKEAWNDFSSEVDIMSSLKHEHITPLIGVCIEDDYLILVYDFLSKGSLEESLHSHSKKCKLPWKVRFKVATAIAEALNYLHNESSQPVIHRDVKSSNILLSNEFQPQLSDFGLAIWGPADSARMIHSDVVGTFGYIAPEYFTHGRVSDKIDVYSFGIVLLELLTGKKPIGSAGLKGQESLVKWATPLLESGNLKALLDPKAGGDFDVVQMSRMVLVARLCIKQSTRLRPNVNQILELLKGEKDEKEWVNCYVNDLIESSNQEVDDIFPESGVKPCLDSSFLDLDDDDASLSSAERKQHFMLKDYFKKRQD